MGTKIIKAITLILICIGLSLVIQKTYIKNYEISLDANHHMLKNHSLGVCINTRLVKDNEIRRDIGEALEGYQQLIKRYGYTNMMEVDKYVDELYIKKAGISKHTNKPIIFMGCMKVYNSKEFNEFIFNLIPIIQKG